MTSACKPSPVAAEAPRQSALVSSQPCEVRDLLAPMLLNVNPGIHGFASLRELRPWLVEHLEDVPDDVDLASASVARIAAVARLFEPLDSRKWLGVRGTTLS